jgi:hypothetical protein
MRYVVRKSNRITASVGGARVGVVYGDDSHDFGWGTQNCEMTNNVEMLTGK